MMQTMILMKVGPHLDDFTAFGWWLKGMIRGEKNAGPPSSKMGSTLGASSAPLEHPCNEGEHL